MGTVLLVCCKTAAVKSCASADTVWNSGSRSKHDSSTHTVARRTDLPCGIYRCLGIKEGYKCPGIGEIGFRGNRPIE